MARIPAAARLRVTPARPLLRRVLAALAATSGSWDAAAVGGPVGPAVHEAADNALGGLAEWKVGWSVPGSIT